MPPREVTLNTLKTFSGEEPRAFTISGYDVKELFNTKIPLGRVVKTADAVFLPSEIRNELENELSTEKDTFAIKLSASPNAKTHLKYLFGRKPIKVF